MDSVKPSMTKLAGTANYQIWAIKMKAYLIAQDVWDAINITSKSMVSDTIKSQNSKAMSLIILHCEDYIIRLIDPDDLAAKAWKKLENQYGIVGFSARHMAFQSLVSTNLSSCESIDHYIDQFRAHISTLTKMTTSPLPQWLLLSILINNVGSQYEAWSQSVMQQIRQQSISEDSTHYLEGIIASLIDEARRTSSNSSTNSISSLNTNTALSARKTAKPKPICKHCGKIHKSENCWEMFPEKKPSARLSSSNSQNKDDSNDTHSSNSIAFLSQIKPEQCHSWILDSGATQHMCNDQAQFTQFEPFTTTITIANNSKMDATGKGNVKLLAKTGKVFTLTNVLFVPQLATNLLSVCCAMKNPHIRFNFSQNKCQIYKKL